LNNRINILGVGSCKSGGINKGSIVDLDLASNTINEAITMAKRSYDSVIEETFISISGTHSKSLRSSGAVNVQSGQITHNEINQVLQMALYNAKIIPDYEVIHVLPLYFKIDDSNEISNPLNMHGSRLEVYANIVTVKKTALVNIQNALKKSNLEVTNFVLDIYASSIAVLEEDQKRLGTVVLDLGGSTSELTIFKGKTIYYNDFISIGSEHITSDLSIMLHTPYNAANMIKNQYANLLPIKNDYNADANQTISKVKIPLLGNEAENKEIPLIQIQPIIHARVEELLCLLKDKIMASGMGEYIDGGIVITGGMSQLKGLQELASKVFDDVPVKILNPINIQNGYIDFNNPSMSTIVGLLKYALDQDPFFELDSNKHLRKKTEDKNIAQSNDENSLVQDDTLSAIKLEDNKRSIWDKIGKWL
jgi:cell division protein FtsA